MIRKIFGRAPAIPTEGSSSVKVILLAAGTGKRLGARTKKTPKCLVPLGGGENLLKRYFRSFRALGLKDIVLVVGHQKEMILSEYVRTGRGLRIRSIENEEYEKGSLLSLFKASEELNEDCLIMDADVYFETRSLKRLVDSKHPSSFLVDPRTKFTGEEMMVMTEGRRLKQIAKKISPSLKMVGESVGFLKIRKNDAERLKNILADFVRRGKTGVEYEEAYNALMQQTAIGSEIITEFWTEMDFEEDLKTIMRRHH